MQHGRTLDIFSIFAAAAMAHSWGLRYDPREDITDVRQEHASRLFLLLKSKRNVARLLSY
jgi:hypothetical protein